MQHYRDFNICLQNQTNRHNRVNKKKVNVRQTSSERTAPSLVYLSSGTNRTEAELMQ